MTATVRKKPATGAQPRARRTVIVGLGRTGLACARYLSAHGARVAITDSRAEPPELRNLGGLAAHLDLRLGGFDAKLLEDAVQVVVSPGVPLSEPFLREALARGIEVVGDIELFARAVRVVGPPLSALAGYEPASSRRSSSGSIRGAVRRGGDCRMAVLRGERGSCAEVS